MGKASLLILSLPESIRTPSSFFCFPSGESRGSFLGGYCYIHLTKGTFYFIIDGTFHKTAPSMILLYFFKNDNTNPKTSEFFFTLFSHKVKISLQPDNAFKSPSHLRFSHQVLLIHTNIKLKFITVDGHLV